MKKEEKKCQVNDPKVGTKCTCKKCMEIKEIKASLRKVYSEDNEYKYYSRDWE